MAHSSDEDTRRLSEGVDAKTPAAVRAGIGALLPRPLKELIKSIMRSPRLRWLNDALQRRGDRRYRIGKPVTSPMEIRAALRGLPLPDGTVVLIHSSMSKLGY